MSFGNRQRKHLNRACVCVCGYVCVSAKITYCLIGTQKGSTVFLWEVMLALHSQCMFFILTYTHTHIHIQLHLQQGNLLCLYLWCLILCALSQSCVFEARFKVRVPLSLARFSPKPPTPPWACFSGSLPCLPGPPQLSPASPDRGPGLSRFNPGSEDLPGGRALTGEGARKTTNSITFIIRD